MIYTIKNNLITAEINSFGAELNSISGADGTAYLCPDERRNWDGKAPVLFPNTGAVNNKALWPDGRTFPYVQHGFARNTEFHIFFYTETKLILCLSDADFSDGSCPGSFDFSICYELFGNQLIVTSRIENNSDTEHFYCSLGFHPGFSCPLDLKTTAEDWFFTFDEPMTASRILLQDGLVSGIQEKFLDGVTTLPVKEAMFDGGSFSMTNLTTKRVCLKSAKSPRFIQLEFEDYPNLVLWAPKNKDLTNICIEPWYGRPDTAGALVSQAEKPDTMDIAPMSACELKFTVTMG